MRKLILNLAVSLDGFIEGPNGEFDWCLTDQDYGMTGFMNRIDAVLFGRKSYQLLKQYEEHPYPDKKKYVFSETLPSIDSYAQVITRNAAQEVTQLKEQPGKDIWLFGGAVLTSHLLNAGLVDELLLSVHPILLGTGKPLFSDIKERVYCQLLHTQSYTTGLVQLHYQVKSKQIGK